MYKLQIDENAFLDIDDAMEYYQSISESLMNKFYDVLHDAFEEIILNPNFQIRYGIYRCLPLLKFPYMIHFKINETEKIVLVLALINTYRNPSTSYLK